MPSKEPASGYRGAGPNDPAVYVCQCVDAKGRPSPGIEGAMLPA